MRYLRVVVATELFNEEAVAGFISLVVDTGPTTPVVIARCSDGTQAQAIVDALNAV